jgi:hypothetical protein
MAGKDAYLNLSAENVFIYLHKPSSRRRLQCGLFRLV